MELRRQETETDKVRSENVYVHQPLFVEEEVTDKRDIKVLLRRGSYDSSRTF